ncbi:MAG: urease accessory protein UreE [Gammaproteobacteria bacterium]|nr:urease accessory protein UreE [Gammaproteobacteria bacterium]MDX5374930.1 urease accessory protein UreE [Gammaproteobacteria bacterium]
MLHIHERIETPAETPALTLTLPFDRRQKSRFRATLDDGSEVAVQLPRGTVLRGGDVLRAVDGRLVGVCAAAEAVSTVAADDARLLARAAYHLGNRHMPLQVGDGWLRYQHDHVLDDMVAALGLVVRFEQAPFEPEAGAYAGGHGHHHGHHHAPQHGHVHEQAHGHAGHAHDH